jgi:uncharacterized protein (DUF952 family)
MNPDTYILHLASNDDWLAAVEKGAYRADSLSTEGFIHCSKPAQVVDVANRFYRGQRGLVLLVIDPSKLESELKWEPPAHPNGEPAAAMGDQLFPHIYGPINLDAVVRVVAFEPDASGNFNLPETLT